MNQLIYEKLTPIFREVFEEDTLVVTGDLTSQTVDLWDSLSNIRLMVGIEEAFNIRFESSEISGLPNVAALVEAIEEHLSK